MPELKKTPLYPVHVSSGARMGEFAGYSMPIYYEGIIQEHRAVRTRAGLFDLCHMGRLWVRGAGAFDFLQRLVTNDLKKLRNGKIIYTPVCNEQGGILDDILIYQVSSDEFFLVVNASNHGKVLHWFHQHMDASVAIYDATAETAFVAVQGPLCGRILARIFQDALPSLSYYHFSKLDWQGGDVLISRTGYTGEDGFELCLSNPAGVALWQELLGCASQEGLVPAGLGARDTLRLEMRYLLYGNDMDEETTPLEAGLGWTVSFYKGEFIGRQALDLQRQQGLVRRLVGFEMIDSAIPRHGCFIYRDEREIGRVSSGSFSPTLNKTIGLGYIQLLYAHVGIPIYIDVRNTQRLAEVVKTPFYRGGTEAIVKLKSKKPELLNSGT